ncbi:uncharacterized protein LOC111117162 isoform X2 [Crassostrea virginica]
MTFSILMLIFVSLAYTSWTNGQDSGAMIRIFMKKRSSFDGNLPLTSECYNSEMKFTNPVQCASQCLTRIELCRGILFNQEYGTCRLIKCNPADAFSVGQFNTGRWELFWRENGWLKHEDHCYFFNERRETWMNARKMCEDNGASLASIRSSEENSWIVDTFLWNSDMCSVHWWKCCVFWIGGNDLAVEGTYVWTSDNSTLGFVNWAPGQPDSFYRNVSNCISLCSNELWIGDYCGNYQQYICKTPEM